LSIKYERRKKNEGVKLKNKKLSQIKRTKSKECGYNLIYKEIK
jgi:hypothetical protein